MTDKTPREQAIRAMDVLIDEYEHIAAHGKGRTRHHAEMLLDRMKNDLPIHTAALSQYLAGEEGLPSERAAVAGKTAQAVDREGGATRPARAHDPDSAEHVHPGGFAGQHQHGGWHRHAASRYLPGEEGLDWRARIERSRTTWLAIEPGDPLRREALIRVQAYNDLLGRPFGDRTPALAATPSRPEPERPCPDHPFSERPCPICRVEPPYDH